ncbi:MAG TPA: substrate-binding domain-containing protein [Terrimicrobiaceae bacterium]
MTKKLFSLIALVGLLAGFPHPGLGQSEQRDLIKPITKKLTIIYVPKVIHPWYDVVHDGAKFAVEEFKKQGIDIDVVWDAPPQANIDDQNRRIEAAIGRRPDALCVASLDPSTNAQILEEAKKAGLNVMTFDTFCDERFPYVGHRQDEQDGYDLGKLLAEKIGGKGKVGILSGSLTAPNHVARVEGFKRAMKEDPDIQIAFERPDNDDLEAAVSLTENALQANPDLAGIFACNASNPIGAARAITNAKKAGQVVIVGMDDLPETIQFIKDGTILATKAQRQWEIGYWTVKYVVALNEGHTIPKEHATGSRLLTKESLK